MPKGQYERLVKECSVEGCVEKHLAKGLCHLHYHRLRNTGFTGDPIRYSDAAPEGSRTCVKCSTVKTLENFRHSVRDGKEYWARTCKLCERSGAKKWQTENPERFNYLQKRGVFKRAYGERGVELYELRISGKGACENCGDSENLHIDHNHVTGEVRGLLCHRCNTALGLLKEDTERIEGLVRYLNSYEITSS